MGFRYPALFSTRALGRCLALLVPLAGALAPRSAAATTEWHLETVAQQRLRLIYTYRAIWPADPGLGLFYLPSPPATGNQAIDDFSTNLSGSSFRASPDSAQIFQRGKVEHVRGSDRVLLWRVTITGTFRMRQLQPGARKTGSAQEEPPDEHFLAATPSLDWTSDTFQAWLDRAALRRRTAESPVDFGRRLYRYLEARGHYVYPPEGGWRASTACRRLASDCGGFSLIFTAACRANRIPARLLVGQWLKVSRPFCGTLESGARQAHVIAEFYDPAIGWIPEDISSTFLHTRGFASNDFFGRDPGYFFAWHLDTDFDFPTPRQPHTRVQWIQNPSFWFGESVAAAADGSSHHWTIEALDGSSSPSRD